jgi:hypothetical protein
MTGPTHRTASTLAEFVWHLCPAPLLAVLRRGFDSNRSPDCPAAGAIVDLLVVLRAAGAEYRSRRRLDEPQVPQSNAKPTPSRRIHAYALVLLTSPSLVGCTHQ